MAYHRNGKEAPELRSAKDFKGKRPTSQRNGECRARYGGPCHVTAYGKESAYDDVCHHGDARSVFEQGVKGVAGRLKGGEAGADRCAKK